MTVIHEFLNDIFIIHENGYCLHHESYGDSNFEVDGVVISGFLSAIETFSSSLDKGAKKLETTNYKFLYHRFKDLIYIARVPKNIEDMMIHHFLEDIAKKMALLIPKSIDLNGNVEPFKIIGQLVHQYFSNHQSIITLDSQLEISGKYERIRNINEAKIFSYLRLKGRTKLSKVIQALKLGEEKAILATKNLIERDLISIVAS